MRKSLSEHIVPIMLMALLVVGASQPSLPRWLRVMTVVMCCLYLVVELRYFYYRWRVAGFIEQMRAEQAMMEDVLGEPVPAYTEMIDELEEIMK